MTKMGNIQNRTLHFNRTQDSETLLYKSGKCTMEVKRLRSISLEGFRSLNNLSSSYLQNMLIKRNYTRRRKTDLQIQHGIQLRL